MRNGMSEKDAGFLGYLASKDTIIENKNKRVEDYNLNPKKCKNCGNIISYEDRLKTFCNSSCSAIYNNKKRKYTQEVKDKISLTLKNSNHNKKKEKRCKYCGSIKGECIDSYVCSKHRLYKSLEIFGFDKKTIGSKDVVDEFYRVYDIIYNFYQKFSSNEDALIKMFNYKSGSANFIKLLKSINIKIKNIKNAISEAYLEGRIVLQKSYNSYKQGWHTTWDNKEVYLRSSYEFDYAKKLDEDKIPYEVESLRIKYWDSQRQEFRCAIPDFYLPATNEIVEIKSRWTLDEQLMKDKIKEYKKLGYNVKVICDYKEIEIN